jgi:drug/metabolite transporter (DMT)-like permease
MEIRCESRTLTEIRPVIPARAMGGLAAQVGNTFTMHNHSVRSHVGHDTRTWLVLGAFAVVYVVWGSTYLAIRFAVESLPPFLMAAVRFLVGGAGLYLVAWWSGADRPTRSQWAHATAIGGLLLVGGNGLVCWAELTVPSGIAALIVATVPLWIVALDTFFFERRRPNWMVWLGLLFGLGGVAILLGPAATPQQHVNPWGATALLGACMFWSIGSLASRNASLPPSLIMSSSLQMLGGGILLLGLGTLLGEWSAVDWHRVTLKSVLALCYLIVIGGMLAFSAYSWLLRVCDTSVVSTYAYVNPVIAVFLGAWLGAEPLTSRIFLGAGLIIVSVVIVISRRSRSTAGTPRVTAVDGEPQPAVAVATEH